MMPQWTTPAFEIVWTRVGPSFGTYPNRDGGHPWHVLPERCEHSVIVGIHCSGCHPIRMDKPVLDWNPRSLNEPTINSFHSVRPNRTKRHVKDKPQSCTAMPETWAYVNNRWHHALDCSMSLVSRDPVVLPQGQSFNSTLFRALEPERPWSYAKALDKAFNSQYTTTSLDQNFTSSGHSDYAFDGEEIVMVDHADSDSSVHSETLHNVKSEFFNGWRLHDGDVVAMPYIPDSPGAIIEQYVLRAAAKFDVEVTAKRIGPKESRNQAIAAILRLWMKGTRASRFPVVQKAIERMQCASESMIIKYRS
jgi:hypothetical protein